MNSYEPKTHQSKGIKLSLIDKRKSESYFTRALKAHQRNLHEQEDLKLQKKKSLKTQKELEAKFKFFENFKKPDLVDEEVPIMERIKERIIAKKLGNNDKPFLSNSLKKHSNFRSHDQLQLSKSVAFKDEIEEWASSSNKTEGEDNVHLNK